MKTTISNLSEYQFRAFTMINVSPHPAHVSIDTETRTCGKTKKEKVHCK